VPGDYDGAWEPTGVDWEALDPVLLDFTDHRVVTKGKYLGEVFPWNAGTAPGEPFTEFFQQDRDGRAKGIIRIVLRDLP